MKNTLFLLLSLCLIIASCAKDDDDNGIDAGPNAELSYDATPQDAPALDAGNYDLGARFSGSTLTQFNGRQLESVAFYILTAPTKCELIIYGEGTDDMPGSPLYTANLTTSVDSESWNTHTLDTPIDINGTDLWLCLRVEHASRIGSLGCDPGPAASNGDKLYSQSSNQWTTLRDFSNGEVDINWNIRGILSE